MSAELEHKIDFMDISAGVGEILNAFKKCRRNIQRMNKRLEGIGRIEIDISPMLDACNEMKFKIDRFIDSEAERVSDPVLRDEIRECFEKESGSKPWGENSEEYNRWKEEHGYPLNKMVKTGKLQDAAEDSMLFGSRSGDVLTLKFVWDAWGPRHDPDWDFGGSEGDEYGDDFFF